MNWFLLLFIWRRTKWRKKFSNVSESKLDFVQHLWRKLRPMIEWQKARIFVAAKETNWSGNDWDFMFWLNRNAALHGRSWAVPWVLAKTRALKLFESKKHSLNFTETISLDTGDTKYKKISNINSNHAMASALPYFAVLFVSTCVFNASKTL